MDLLLTAGMPWVTILYVILIDWIMIITGLIGALVSSEYKWGFFAFGKLFPIPTGSVESGRQMQDADFQT